MNCEAFRQTCDADPACTERAFLEHATRCESCAQYRRAAQRLESLVDRALRIPVPEPRAVDVAPRRFRPRRAWHVALAAAAAIALVAGASLLSAERAGRALANEAIAHVVAEPQAFAADDAAIPPAAAARMIGGRRVELRSAHVVYAMTCPFHGRQIAHWVVRTREGPVSVLLIPGERLKWPVGLAARGLKGRVVPVRDGVLALVAEATVPAAVQAEIAAAIVRS